MIRRMADKSHVGMVISSDYDDDEDNSYCSTCMAVGEMNKLKERLYLDSTGKRLPPPPDAEDWLQCWVCGLIIPVRETMKQGKLSGIQGIDIIQNPYDEKKGSILGIDSRLSSRTKNIKRRQSKHPDKEIQAYLDKGWELKSYSDSLPI